MSVGLFQLYAFHLANLVFHRTAMAQSEGAKTIALLVPL